MSFRFLLKKAVPVCAQNLCQCLAAGCHREGESLPNPSSTHGPYKKLEERRLNGSYHLPFPSVFGLKTTHSHT